MAAVLQAMGNDGLMEQGGFSCSCSTCPCTFGGRSCLSVGHTGTGVSWCRWDIGNEGSGGPTSPFLGLTQAAQTRVPCVRDKILMLLASGDCRRGVSWCVSSLPPQVSLDVPKLTLGSLTSWRPTIMGTGVSQTVLASWPSAPLVAFLCDGCCVPYTCSSCTCLYDTTWPSMVPQQPRCQADVPRAGT